MLARGQVHGAEEPLCFVSGRLTAQRLNEPRVEPLRSGQLAGLSPMSWREHVHVFVAGSQRCSVS